MALSRVELAERSEGLRRLYRITIARTVALAASYGLILIVAPSDVWLYLFAVIVGFIVIGWLQFWMAKKEIGGWWRTYVAIMLDFAMLTFVLIYPPPGSPEDLNPAFFLKFDSFDFLYIILGALAISLRPGLLIWGGICAVTFW